MIERYYNEALMEKSFGRLESVRRIREAQIELTISNLSDAFSKSVSVFKIDYDQSKKTIKTLGVHRVPGVYFLKQGNLIDQLTGIISRKELTQKIQVLSSSLINRALVNKN